MFFFSTDAKRTNIGKIGDLYNVSNIEDLSLDDILKERPCIPRFSQFLKTINVMKTDVCEQTFIRAANSVLLFLFIFINSTICHNSQI